MLLFDFQTFTRFSSLFQAKGKAKSKRKKAGDQEDGEEEDEQHEDDEDEEGDEDQEEEEEDLDGMEGEEEEEEDSDEQNGDEQEEGEDQDENSEGEAETGGRGKKRKAVAKAKVKGKAKAKAKSKSKAKPKAGAKKKAAAKGKGRGRGRPKAWSNRGNLSTIFSSQTCARVAQRMQLMCWTDLAAWWVMTDVQSSDVWKDATPEKKNKRNNKTIVSYWFWQMMHVRVCSTWQLWTWLDFAWRCWKMAPLYSKKFQGFNSSTVITNYIILKVDYICLNWAHTWCLKETLEQYCYISD